MESTVLPNISPLETLLPPAAPQLNKKARAKFAKDTINILIPSILKSNPRALAAVNNSTIVRYDPTQSISTSPHPAPSKGVQPSNPNAKSQNQPPPEQRPGIPSRPGNGTNARYPRIKVLRSDTFDAVRMLYAAKPHNRSSSGKGRPQPKIAALNMASPLRPGGGVLNGARAQEESLCLRSTLYPSLREEWYRMPDDAAVYTPDVLIFRDSGLRELEKGEWFWVDMISGAAVRFPDLVVRERGEVGRGDMVYENEADREAMEVKVRLVFQIAALNGVSHLVLGAWGCGAYGNPASEVARIFKKVIFGRRGRGGIGVAETGIEEVVFAILDGKGENLRVFEDVFADVMGDEDVTKG